MVPLTDIKPDITVRGIHTPCPPPQTDVDVKPNPFETAGAIPSRQRDFRKEREVLKKQYDLQKRNLDLEEEIRLLRATKPAVKNEITAGEIKPDIPRLVRGITMTPLDLDLLQDSDDEDDVVFIREFKPGSARTRIPGRISSTFNVKAEPSSSEDPVTAKLGGEGVPSTPVVLDRRTQSSRLPASIAEHSGKPRSSLPPHVISVEWISDRLDRSCYKYRMTVEYLGQWAAWWPRTKVAQHHRLDSAGVWLLTVGVHKWWSDLYDELNSSDVKWPEGLDEIGQEDITMRVEEIMLAKESAMVAANRLMLKNGETISVESVLHLRHGRR